MKYKEPSMENPYTKKLHLNFFQLGYHVFLVQLFFIILYIFVIVALCCLIKIGSIWLSLNGLINKQYFQRDDAIYLIKLLFNNFDINSGDFLLFVICALSIFSIYLIPKFFFKQELPFASFKLPKAVELSYAMSQFGITLVNDMIYFIEKNRVDIFITECHMEDIFMEDIRVRRYCRIPNFHMIDFNFFTSNIGLRRICLNRDEYDALNEKFGKQSQSALQDKVTCLECDKTKLQEDISKLQEENRLLKSDNDNLYSELAALKKQAQTIPGRNARITNRALSRIPFWRVGGPVLNRLYADAHDGTAYTRKDIQEAFELELRQHPSQLQQEILQLIATPGKEQEGRNLALDGWAMEAIRYGLGDLAKKDAGAPSKRN